MGVKGRKNNNHPFTIEGLYSRLVDRAGMRYAAETLSRQFKVSVPDMKQVLDQLAADGKIIKSKMVRRGDVYYFPTPDHPEYSKLAKERKPFKAPKKPEFEMAEYRRDVRPFRELKGYEASLRAAMIRR